MNASLCQGAAMLACVAGEGLSEYELVALRLCEVEQLSLWQAGTAGGGVSNIHRAVTFQQNVVQHALLSKVSFELLAVAVTPLSGKGPA